MKFTKEDAQKIGDQLNLDWSKYNIDEFTMGLNVELEHGIIDPITNVTDDDNIKTAKIALAHLNELPDYYTRLKAMENDSSSHLEDESVNDIDKDIKPIIKSFLGALIKSKKFPTGTIRNWGGKDYKKVADGDWQEVKKPSEGKKSEGSGKQEFKVGQKVFDPKDGVGSYKDIGTIIKINKDGTLNIKQPSGAEYRDVNPKDVKEYRQIDDKPEDNPNSGPNYYNNLSKEEKIKFFTNDVGTTKNLATHLAEYDWVNLSDRVKAKAIYSAERKAKEQNKKK